MLESKRGTMGREKHDPIRSQQSQLRKFATATLGESGARYLASKKSELDSFRVNHMTDYGRQNSRQISEYKDIHSGERCVIIGNGPSLNQTNLKLLENETTFGLNRIYLMFDKLGFSTDYHVVVNQLVVEQCAEDFLNVKAPLFTTSPNRTHLNKASGPNYMNKLIGPRFSQDITKGIWEGATVTYVAMQIAAYMGFSKVILVGVDHNFTSKGPAHKQVESEGDDPNHFDPNYFGKGFKWQLPDLETSEIAYGLAKINFENRGGSILDATVGGKLNVFEKVNLEEALR